MKHLKTYQLFELHTDTYQDVLHKLKNRGDFERAIRFRDTYFEITGEELDPEWDDEDYKNIIAIAKGMDIDLTNTTVEKGVHDHYGLPVYSFEEEDDSREFCIATDEEADRVASEYIEDTVWAFNTDFIMRNIKPEHVISYFGIDTEYVIEGEDGEPDETIEMDEDEAIEHYFGQDLETHIKMLQERADSGNDEILKFITNIDNFIENAIDADGRGHFMSSYDGKEKSVEIGDETLYIYRVN